MNYNEIIKMCNIFILKIQLTIWYFYHNILIWILRRRKFMSEFKAEFYENEKEIPVKEFLDSLDIKMRTKFLMEIKLLEEKGNALREPYSKPLGNGIFELRAKVGTDISRVLYFFYYEGRIILTHGFIKKTQKTPKNEIKKAEQYRKDFIERNGKQYEI